MKEKIAQHFAGHQEMIEVVRRELAAEIERCAGVLIEALRAGRKVLLMGNGGSAADAQHAAAELVGRFRRNRRGLPALALTTDTSILTALGNDFGFDEVFKRQVEAFAVAGDVVVGLSTSGNSNNVCHGLTLANQLGCTTVGLLGRDGGNMGPVVEVNLTVPVQETARIQEGHALILHILCDLVEEALFPPEEPA